jgi:HTH-type transcriptional regulator / antitoxin HipB
MENGTSRELKPQEISSNGIDEHNVGKDNSTNHRRRSFKLEFPFKQDIIGSIIKAYRKIRSLSQDELGEKVGVKKSQISKIEKGDKNLTIGTITKLLKALRAKITFKIELENKKEVALLEQVVQNNNNNQEHIGDNYM